MRFKIIFLVIVAVVLALSVQQNTGQVTFFVAGYRLDISWNLFLLVSLCALGLSGFVINVIRHLIELPKRAKDYQARQKKDRAYYSLHMALRYFYDGRFGQALKFSQLAQFSHDITSSADLLAAQAAHRALQFSERDRYLELERHPKDAHHAVLIARASFAIEDRQFVLALELLTQAKKVGRRHLYPLQLELKARQRLGQWQEVLNLIANLKKYSALLPIIEEKYAEQAYLALFSEAVDEKSVRALWRQMPRHYQDITAISAAAAGRYIDFSLYGEAYKVMLQSISSEGPAAVTLAQYARLGADTAHIAEYLQECENWLTRYPRPLEVLICLGDLCIQQKLWGKAQVYLERALRSAQNHPERLRSVHLLLARLFDHGFDKDISDDGQTVSDLRATAHYRAAAQLN